MAHEDFKTLYKAEFSSGGPIQYGSVPQVIQTMMAFRVQMESKYEYTSPVIDMIETLTDMYAVMLHKPEELYERIKTARALHKHWQQHHPSEVPLVLIECVRCLYRDFWTKFNKCGAGIVSTPYDPSRGERIRDHIVGNPTPY